MAAGLGRIVEIERLFGNNGQVSFPTTSGASSSTAVASPHAMTGSRPITQPSSSWHLFGYGCAFMSSRPRLETERRGRYEGPAGMGLKATTLISIFVLNMNSLRRTALAGRVRLKNCE